MTPNLTRLLDETKQPTRRGEYYYDVWQTIMMNHGEALIAALEGVLDPKNHGGFTLANERAKALLAQLEQEAQP